MQEHDAKRAVGDLPQALIDCLHVLRGLRVDVAQKGLAEVRQVRRSEAAHEALAGDDAHVVATHVVDRGRTLQHLDPGALEDRFDLVGATGMPVVIAQDGDDRDVQRPAGFAQDCGLLGIPAGRQIPVKEDEVSGSSECGERVDDLLAVGLAAVDVAGRRHANRLHPVVGGHAISTHVWRLPAWPLAATGTRGPWSR